jgi:hypothetical protein
MHAASWASRHLPALVNEGLAAPDSALPHHFHFPIHIHTGQDARYPRPRWLTGAVHAWYCMPEAHTQPYRAHTHCGRLDALTPWPAPFPHLFSSSTLYSSSVAAIAMAAAAAICASSGGGLDIAASWVHRKGKAAAAIAPEVPYYCRKTPLAFAKYCKLQETVIK